MESDQRVFVIGEVIDGVCFANGLRGPNHKTCAETCFARGEAAIALADDGTGWVLLADHGNEKLLHAAKASAGSRVTLVGLPKERGGIRGLSVTEVIVHSPQMQ